MKKLKIIALLFLLCAFAANTAKAQAIVVQDHPFYIFELSSLDSHLVLTPDGTLNIWATWQLPLDHPLVPSEEEGAVEYGVGLQITIWGIPYQIPGVLKINPAGKMKVEFHYEL